MHEMVKQNGGHSIAVYNPKKQKKDVAKHLIKEERVNFICAADYSKGSEIYKVVTTIIDKIKSDFEFESLLSKHKNKAGT